jgi:apolipoprotein N-acyltransferase
VQYLKGGGIPPVLSAPVLWTVLEYTKSHLLTGFPWENLGCSQYLWGNLIQFADIAGVYGISFLIVLVNVLLYDLIGRGHRRVVKVVALVVVMGLVLAYGVYRSADVARNLAIFPTVPVRSIQGNVDQSVKWNPAFQRKTMEDYVALTLEGAPVSGGVVVWPETAVPFFFQDIDAYHRIIVSLAQQTGSWLLLGSPSYKKTEEGRTVQIGRAHV